MRARLPAGDYRSSLHVQYHHPSCRAAEFTPCSPAGQGGVRVTIARADTRTSTRIRRVMVLQQRSRRVQIDGCTYNMYFCHARLSCRNNAPGVAPSLPVFFPRPLLGFHTTRASLPPSSIMARVWQLGRQGCPFLPVPPLDHGKHRVRIFGRTNRPISHPWTLLRVAPLCVLSLRSGGPHRLSSASLLRLRKSSPHPQTSSRAQPVTTSRCDTVLSSPSLLPGITS